MEQALGSWTSVATFETAKTHKKLLEEFDAGQGGGPNKKDKALAGNDAVADESRKRIVNSFEEMGGYFKTRKDQLAGAVGLVVDYQTSALDLITKISPELTEDSMGAALEILVSDVSVCAGFCKLPNDMMRHIWLKRKLGASYGLVIA
jgi:hypothetical protein